MKVLVFGSANIDKTYSVDHFVGAGETISANKMELFCGGKGFNQAIAFARAGSETFFAGAIGEDGDFLCDMLHENGIDIRFLKKVPGPSGHAIIQVARDGSNCIMILAGANGMITTQYAEEVLNFFSPGDLVVLQNEISNVAAIIDNAKARGMLVALNPSPYNEKVEDYDLEKVDYLLVNEIEGAYLTGKTAPKEIVMEFRSRWPHGNLLLTLGSEGSWFSGANGENFSCGIYPVKALDTTAAGDTFSGYFLSEAISTGNNAAALSHAAVASGIAVSRRGASPSIPFRSEVDAVKTVPVPRTE